MGRKLLVVTGAVLLACVAGICAATEIRLIGKEVAHSGATQPVGQVLSNDSEGPDGPTVTSIALPSLGATRRESMDMTELARQFQPHKGPTTIFVNFDGWRNFDKKGHDIQPFQATTKSRDRDMQEILYRTTEIFAPFNVQVVRIVGDGKSDGGTNGNTTVFVGGNTRNIDAKGQKFTEAVTPGPFMDYPSVATSTSHRPHSNPFGIAFVAPMVQNKSGGWSSLWNNTVISRKIAHEAGHTFGLAHILTHGFPDLMSYDADPRSHFADRTFPVTDLNFNPVKGTRDHTPKIEPNWQGTAIKTENTFSYLMAVLGPRPDDHAKVVDVTTVDGNYQEATPAQLVPGTPITAAIEPRGDYDVYRLEVSAGSQRSVRVQPSAGSSLKPVIMVFSAAGRKLVGFATSDRGPDGSCQIRVGSPDANRCQIVVGAVDGASTGNYELTVSRPELQTALSTGR
jgi:hypothetical protein